MTELFQLQNSEIIKCMKDILDTGRLTIFSFKKDAGDHVIKISVIGVLDNDRYLLYTKQEVLCSRYLSHINVCVLLHGIRYITSRQILNDFIKYNIIFDAVPVEYIETIVLNLSAQDYKYMDIYDTKS